ncbi:hypothetical protein T484DRAFT_2837119 [Baffinella frigidus]|nr:hypothetical protein T484DRAFT_2837119 [Cryptophyta sp. CCMP2293]
MSEIPAISRVTDKGEFRVFKKSQYTSDGWEPFLPRNPLDGTPFEGIAVAFEKRRQRLDAVRTSDVGLQNLNEDVLKSLPRRTARRLAQVNPKPLILNPKPYTPNPKPETLTPNP